MSGQLASLEEDKSQYQEQLTFVLQSLKDDADNAELLALQEELETAIQMIDEAIVELKPKKEPAKAAPAPAPSPPPVQEKWSRENHPAFKKPAPEEKDKEQEAAPVSYQVNDTVLAKWVSGDKGFYTARITSITGSSTQPVYTVKFKSYDTVETLRARDIRPVAQKRKADGTPVTAGGASSSTAAVPNTAQPAAAPAADAASNGVVTSVAASMYPQAQAAAEGEGADGAPAKKFKKIKAKKELEAGKSKWQDFNNKSKFGKNNKKDSMFRTPEGVHGRVGFTGSGQAMRKDATRSRHIHQANEDLD